MTDLKKCIGKILSLLETVETFEAWKDYKNQGKTDVPA